MFGGIQPFTFAGLPSGIVAVRECSDSVCSDASVADLDLADKSVVLGLVIVAVTETEPAARPVKALAWP